MYLRLAEGEDDLLGSERSLSRRLLVLLVGLVLLLASLAAAAVDDDPVGVEAVHHHACARPGLQRVPILDGIVAPPQSQSVPPLYH